MARGDFFSGSEKKEKRIAGNLGPSTPIRGEYTLGPLNKNQGAAYPSNVRPKDALVFALPLNAVLVKVTFSEPLDGLSAAAKNPVP